MPRKASDITITDQFCGAGGSSIGAEAAGGRLRMALNHWKLAIETHNTNFPHADHDCTDVSACDPRRYPSTDILITSPECTNHSLAKGKKRKLAQLDAFTPAPVDPAEERSRATMWDVPRFAEFHRYNVVIVENVVDATHWLPFPAWLHAMHRLGYEHRIVYLNSMFCWPTPQSRDRMYVVFWRKGNPEPDLAFRPPAWCPRCEANVEAVQSWKPGRNWGRYQRQYVYCCPSCAAVVDPYYYAALNALDFSIPAERIGDRAPNKALKPRTRERIRYGLTKYGRRPLVITTRYTTGYGLQGAGRGSRGAADAAPLPSQTARPTAGVVVPPAFLMTYRNYEGADGYPIDALEEPLRTVVGNNQHRLVINGAALLALRDYKRPEQLARGLDETLHTQIAAPQLALVQRAPFLVSYYNGSDVAVGGDEPIRTVTGTDRHAVVTEGDELDVDDCYFRMLQPHEIGAGMAFPSSYKVLGNKRDQVKQYGNAVTPPAMRFLVERAVQSLTGERKAA